MSSTPHSGASPLPSDSHQHSFHDLLLALVVVLVAAKLAGELFERQGQPAVTGEILAGILIGNVALAGIGGFPDLRHNAALAALSELGVILLLFEVGLESDIAEMRKVGVSSMLVAVIGVVVPGFLGFLTAGFFLPGEPVLLHAFVGAALCATSVGITARVLKDLGQLKRAESRIILGAAVVDDVLGLVVLAVIAGLIQAAGTGESPGAASLLLIIAKALGFLVGAIAVGGYLSRRLFRLASFLHVQQMLLVTSLAFCFLLALLAGAIGLAPIVGAFAAGLILDPVHYRDFQRRGENRIEDLIRPISGFLVPVFFVFTGMNVDLGAALNPQVLLFAAVLTAAAVLGKQACQLGVLQKGLNRAAVGLGMAPRGEVGLIFANIGLGLHLPGPDGAMEPVVSPGVFSAIIVVVLVTTLLTPPLLKRSLAREAGPAQEETPAHDAVT